MPSDAAAVLSGSSRLLAANLGLAASALDLGVQQGLDREALQAMLLANSGRGYACIPAGQPFRHGSTLLEKVRLLGEVAGGGDSAFVALQQAAERLGG